MVKKLLLNLWQAPQNILGWLVYHSFKGYEICNKTICGEGIKCKLSADMHGGITLGDYIVVNNYHILDHELGHTKQSKILGPLYLLVIGLPSIIHACLHSRVCKNKDYYHFFTEYLFFDK